MTARAYRDVGQRLVRLPGRLWCMLCHRRMWKRWRTIDSRSGHLWIAYRCRIDGHEFIYPQGSPTR